MSNLPLTPNGISDVPQILPVKTLKRKNFKALSLPSNNDRPSNIELPTPQLANSRPTRVTAPPPPPLPSNSNRNSMGNPAITSSSISNTSYNSHGNIVAQLASLELGVEFKLDLKEEDFENITELGHGNGGTVSKVVHTPTKTVMAKKVIHLETKPAVRKQIARELHIMHDCESDYIVGYYGGFVTENNVIICMEYMDCGSLDRISKLSGPISEPIISKITFAVVQGLTYLYDEHRIIHRDVKPSNVLVNSRGQVKLCDFGVSGELINSLAETFVGTSTYMSPERIQGAAYSVKGDVWSLGLTVLELAIGKFPFSNGGGSILDLLQRIVNEEPPSLPEGNSIFSAQFRKFVDKCLYKEPQRPTPHELLDNDAFILTAKHSSISIEEWARHLRIQ